MQHRDASALSRLQKKTDSKPDGGDQMNQIFRKADSEEIPQINAMQTGSD